jgi:hypothetical protein
MEFTPTLLWSQTYENIEIEINLPNISNEIFNCENNIFHFECLSSNKKYLIDFELEMDVTEYNISNRNDKKIVLLLHKKEEGEKWNFLTKKRGIYKNNIKINWDKWENSDDDDDDEVKNIDMGNMMGGGMGGMGGMDGIESMDMNMLQEMMANMGSEGDGEDYEDGEDCEDGEDGEDDEDGEDMAE